MNSQVICVFNFSKLSFQPNVSLLYHLIKTLPIEFKSGSIDPVKCIKPPNGTNCELGVGKKLIVQNGSLFEMLSSFIALASVVSLEVMSF